MARGVPVACSDRPPMTEVAGDAAQLFDPTSPRAIADAVTALLQDDALRRRLVDAGSARAARFTWESTARGTVAAYARALAR
jgi:glycosyltransferase involved in cell wall biosynthesis